MPELVPTQAKAKVSVSLDGVDLGSFITKEGGGTQSEALKIRPGGGEKEKSYGTPSTNDNVTIAKLYDGNMKARSEWIRGRVGKGTIVVSDQPLDEDDNPFGKPDTYTGGLIRFDPPDRDANAKEFAMCELELTVDGVG